MKYKIDQILPLETSGLRPLLIWVPDIHAPGFAEECRRQSASLAHDDAETAPLHSSRLPETRLRAYRSTE